MKVLASIFPDDWTQQPFEGGYLSAPELNLGVGEWVFVCLSTVIIFAILGPRLWRDLVER